MAAFVPPKYADIGKALKDLLSKKYDYKNAVAVKHNVAPDTSLESTVNVGNGVGDWSGAAKLKYKNKDLGELESEVNTKGPLTAELKANKLPVNGLTVTAKGTDAPLARLGAEYRAESVSGSVHGEIDSSSSKLEATVVAGVDGFSVGGQGVFDVDEKHVKDYNLAAEYTHGDFTATAKTADRLDKLYVGYYHTVPSSRPKLKTQVGGGLQYNIKSGEKALTFGAEHDIDEATSAKAKVDSHGNAAAQWEHRLTNPALKVAFSAAFDADKRDGVKPNKFGAHLTFGDY